MFSEMYIKLLMVKMPHIAQSMTTFVLYQWTEEQPGPLQASKMESFATTVIS